jgi:transcriptional regulator with XRE-family HTH domain
MKTARQRFADNIKFLRRRDLHTQEWCARYLGIPRSTYSSYECAYAEPDFELLLKICKLYKTKPTFLIDRDLKTEGYASINRGTHKTQ